MVGVIAAIVLIIGAVWLINKLGSGEPSTESAGTGAWYMIQSPRTNNCYELYIVTEGAASHKTAAGGMAQVSC